VRAFVQVGTTWQEVPLEAAQPPRVRRVEGSQTFEFHFVPEMEHFEQVLPGYLHVRFVDTILASARARPDRDVVEREESDYVYLQPLHADPADLRKRNGFTGEAPLWIPMPPH
jgi:hypothetical protein